LSVATVPVSAVSALVVMGVSVGVSGPVSVAVAVLVVVSTAVAVAVAVPVALTVSVTDGAMVALTVGVASGSPVAVTERVGVAEAVVVAEVVVAEVVMAEVVMAEVVMAEVVVAGVAVVAVAATPGPIGRRAAAVARGPPWTNGVSTISAIIPHRISTRIIPLARTRTRIVLPFPSSHRRARPAAYPLRTRVPERTIIDQRYSASGQIVKRLSGHFS